jgi:hypothetical protein
MKAKVQRLMSRVRDSALRGRLSPAIDLAKSRFDRRAFSRLFQWMPSSIRQTSNGAEPSSEQPPTIDNGEALRRPVPGVFTDRMLRLNDAAAGKQGVEAAVHPDDFIYWYVCGHPSFTLESAITYYFDDGRRSSDKLVDQLAALGYRNGERIKLLEFASGYGCVTRHLKKHLSFDLMSCDIHPQAIDFLATRIGVKTLQSAHVPEQFAHDQKYDVVFALSFFSHMPKSSFGRWIRALYNALTAPGYLVFTTHGLKTCASFGITPGDIPSDGFWFTANSEQKDLDSAEYGSALSTPDFVAGEIARQTGAPIVAYKHGEWWSHQDLWVIKREQ